MHIRRIRGKEADELGGDDISWYFRNRPLNVDAGSARKARIVHVYAETVQGVRTRIQIGPS